MRKADPHLAVHCDARQRSLSTVRKLRAASSMRCSTIAVVECRNAHKGAAVKFDAQGEGGYNGHDILKRDVEIAGQYTLIDAGNMRSVE